MVDIHYRESPCAKGHDGIDVSVHGHLHLFEALSFKSKRPVSFVMGNSGSAAEGAVPTQLPPDSEPYPGTVVDDYAARTAHGFAPLDRMPSDVESHWLLTEYTALGKAIYRCDIVGSQSRCVLAAEE